MFRTDPLTDTGVIDTQFFASEEYTKEQESLVKYLYDEGFDHVDDNFTIDYRSRKWYVSLEKNKKKRK
jgi:hypothetical protein